MAVQLVTSILTWQGLSTDTKPTGAAVPNGSTFYETDTGVKFIFAGDDGWTEDLSLIYALSQVIEA